MTPKVRVLVWSVAGLTSLAWAGCGSNPPLGTQIGQQAPLASDPSLACPSAGAQPCGHFLAQTRDAVLLRAGDGFVLAGFDGNSVGWGQLRGTGELSGEAWFDLPEQPVSTADKQRLGPFLAVTSKTVPGDQLVVVMGVYQAGYYDVHAWVHDLGSPARPVLQDLGAQRGATETDSVRLVVGSSPDGTRALVAWGVEGKSVPIQYQMLGADGVVIGDQRKIYDDPNVPFWSCLDTTQNNAANLAVTLLEAPTPEHPLQPRWHRFAIGDDGSIGEQVLIDLKFDVTDCRIVSTPAFGGYLLGWQNDTSNGGTYFASFTPPPPDAGPDALYNVTIQPALASASWGGYSQMPKLAWIAPAGYEFNIGLAGSRGPEVDRFNFFADPRGKTLYLPSGSGNTGPVSAWVGIDAVYVTYLDMPGSPSDAGVPAGSQRYLVTVLSPPEPL